MVKKETAKNKKTQKIAKKVLKQETPTLVEQKRPVNYPILSFVLFLTALFIWFIVGKMFMEMAVDENLCQIRYQYDKEPSGEIVAVIGNDNIYMSEIKDYANTIPQLSELPFEMIYPQLLETVINARVLKLGAEQAGIEDLPKVQKALTLAHDQIIAQAYLDKKLAQAITEERLKERYQTEIQNFKPVKEIRAKHILLKSEQEAKDVLIQLKAGAAFEMLAAKYSQDKSAPDGDLGYFTEDMMIPEFGRAVFALKKNQLSEPIKTPFGWHVAVVQDIRQSTPPSFDEVKEDLKQMIMEQDAQKIMDDEKKGMNVKIKRPKI